MKLPWSKHNRKTERDASDEYRVLQRFNAKTDFDKDPDNSWQLIMEALNDNKASAGVIGSEVTLNSLVKLRNSHLIELAQEGLVLIESDPFRDPLETKGRMLWALREIPVEMGLLVTSSGQHLTPELLETLIAQAYARRFRRKFDPPPHTVDELKELIRCRNHAGAELTLNETEMKILRDLVIKLTVPPEMLGLTQVTKVTSEAARDQVENNLILTDPLLNKSDEIPPC